jgi:hypothetical protein
MHKKDNTTLLILAQEWAAVSGGLNKSSRRPNGEIILDYSIYDAIRQDSPRSFL